MTNGHTAVCFTGRRPRDLFGYASHMAYVPLRSRLEEAIEQFIDTEGVDTFISGGAQGTDQLAFWAVENVKRRRRNIRNVVYVPFKGQERKWQTTGVFGQEEYDLMLMRADDIRYIGELDETSGNRYEAVRLLFERNDAMLNDSLAVISVFPETASPRVSRGGTASTICTALARDIPVYNIDPVTLNGTFPAFL